MLVLWMSGMLCSVSRSVLVPLPAQTFRAHISADDLKTQLVAGQICGSVLQRARRAHET